MAGLFASYNLGDLNLSHSSGGPCSFDEVPSGRQGTSFLGFPVSPPRSRSKLGRTSSELFIRKGGIIFCRLWHAGRASHRTYQPGLGAPVSSTNQPISSKWRILLENGTQDMFTDPRALETSEVSSIIEEYRRAAKNSVKAGLDGIEIHGGHGYLIDQFLKESINDRMLLASTVSALGFSPAFYYNDASESDPLDLGLTIIGRITEFQARVGVKLSYLHVTRPRFLGSLLQDIAGENERKEGRLMRAWRDAYEGTFMPSGGFIRETETKALADRDTDLVAYGRLFISNPDLVQRFKVGATLNAYDRANILHRRSICWVHWLPISLQ
ncbi:hypothetical protein MLD38_015385 [Melastoma candidum]|uniref:Uncharacterized protein n=1 Tax=Melastoma candidum TaxID=119954 RepID=A0ACB9RGI4_9MYRT|nr:hypothetical protein MLD38_015385 [Melastoma candidum]